MLAWLRGGNDRELAKRYDGRESASDRKARKEQERSDRRRHTHRRTGAARADRDGWAWTDRQR